MRTALLIFVILMWSCALGECGAVAYGTPVKYSSNTVVSYPDFTVRYLGTRREIPKIYPRGFLYYDFEVVSNQGTRVQVSWSSGTGSLGPVQFTIDGGKYFLELKANSLERNPEKRWLKEGEMIIWRSEVYLEKQRELSK